MKLKKEKGQIGTIIPLFFFLFALVLIMFLLQTFVYRIVSNDTEDALAASNLASAVIDIQEYGTSHNMIIPDPDEAFRIYKDALQVNMGLDEHMNCINNAAISGQVEILEYIVYNVRGNDIEMYGYGERYYSQAIPGGKGTVTAPNGQLIESTSVYSKITFPVDGYFNIRIQSVKDKLVDIARN